VLGVKRHANECGLLAGGGWTYCFSLLSQTLPTFLDDVNYLFAVVVSFSQS